jgi:hypothetical protein
LPGPHHSLDICILRRVYQADIAFAFYPHHLPPPVVQPRFPDQNVSRFEIRYVKANADDVSGVLPALFCGPVSADGHRTGLRTEVAGSSYPDVPPRCWTATIATPEQLCFDPRAKRQKDAFSVWIRERPDESYNPTDTSPTREQIEKKHAEV